MTIPLYSEVDICKLSKTQKECTEAWGNLVISGGIKSGQLVTLMKSGFGGKIIRVGCSESWNPLPLTYKLMQSKSKQKRMVMVRINK